MGVLFLVFPITAHALFMLKYVQCWPLCTWCEKTVQNLVLFAYDILHVVVYEKVNDASLLCCVGCCLYGMLLMADAQEQFPGVSEITNICGSAQTYNEVLHRFSTHGRCYVWRQPNLSRLLASPLIIMPCHSRMSKRLTRPLISILHKNSKEARGFMPWAPRWRG